MNFYNTKLMVCFTIPEDSRFTAICQYQGSTTSLFIKNEQTGTFLLGQANIYIKKIQKKKKHVDLNHS